MYRPRPPPLLPFKSTGRFSRCENLHDFAKRGGDSPGPSSRCAPHGRHGKISGKTKSPSVTPLYRPLEPRRRASSRLSDGEKRRELAVQESLDTCQGGSRTRSQCTGAGASRAFAWQVYVLPHRWRRCRAAPATPADFCSLPPPAPRIGFLVVQPTTPHWAQKPKDSVF